MAINLLNLPHEVLHCILVNADPSDLGRLCCCHSLNDFIKNDRILYKELYLKHFDGLPQGPAGEEPSWATELKKLVKFRKILESKDPNTKAKYLSAISQSVQDLLATAAVGSESGLNVLLLTTLFESQQNRDSILCRSSLFQWAKEEAWGYLSPNRHQRDLESILMATASETQPDLDGIVERAGRGVDESTTASLGVTDRSSMEVDNNGIEAATYVVPDAEIAPIEHHTKSITHQSESQPSSIEQLSAKLHCLYGASIDTVRKDTSVSSRYSLRSDSLAIHPYARSRVYDLRQHTETTFWGPYFDDGKYTVDWEKMEAIMAVLDHNVRLTSSDQHELHGLMEVQGSHRKPFAGATPYSFVSPPMTIPMQPALPLEAQDPYAVTGTWTRIVCFLDYSELYDFNFSDDEAPDNDQPRGPIDTTEAIRLIQMRLYITKIEPPGEDDGQSLPVVHFRGSSSASRPHYDPNANSRIKGTVRLTPQGEVAWTTFSVYNGEERWRSEGIQIGGIQSARGVLGYWFDKDHDIHGPAGPTSFWKLHDGIEEKKPTPTTGHGVQLFTLPLY